MRVHHLQHVPFEGLGSMEPDLKARGWTLTSTHLYRGDELPGMDQFDWLVIMGGPMNIYDEDDHPWLQREKKFIHDAISSGKTILGICFGAQLIADALGAGVHRNAHREIGWFPIEPSPEAGNTILGSVFTQSMNVYHWHGDEFDVPADATLIASSEACTNQAFIVDDRIIGLQFHLETTQESAAALIEHCGDELDGTRYVQSGDNMMGDEGRFASINETMARLLLAMENAQENRRVA